MTFSGAGGPRGGGAGASLSDARAGVESALRDRQLLRRIGGLFRPYRGELWVIAGLIVITSGLGVVAPLLLKVVFDRALFVSGGPRLGLLYVLLAVMVASTVVSALVGIWQNYLTTAVGQRVLRDLRTRLYTHLQTLSLRFFTATRTGDIQSRLQNDVGGLQTVITDTASTILSNTVTLVSTVIALFILSWQLALLSLALTPLFVWLTGRVGRTRRTISAQTQGALSDMSALTEETLSVSGALLSKLFNSQQRSAAIYAGENERLAALSIRQQLVSRAFWTRPRPRSIPSVSAWSRRPWCRSWPGGRPLPSRTGCLPSVRPTLSSPWTTAGSSNRVRTVSCWLSTASMRACIKSSSATGSSRPSAPNGVRLSDGHVITLEPPREPGSLDYSGAAPVPEPVSR